MHNRVNDTVAVILHCFVTTVCTVWNNLFHGLRGRTSEEFFLSFAPGTVTLYCLVKTGSNLKMILVNYVAMV